MQGIETGQAGGGLFGNDGGEKQVVAVKAQFTVPANGEPARLFVTATIEPGWHIYSITQPPGGPVATTIHVAPPKGVKIAGKFQPSRVPEKKPEAAFDNLIVESHHGTVTWYAPLAIADGVDTAKLEIPGSITVQACDAKSCLPPTDIKFVAKLGPGVPLFEQTAHRPEATIEPSESSTQATAPLPLDVRLMLVQLGFAFLGGLILNLMPCVLPVISLKILAFVQQSGESRGRVFALNVWYSIGLLSVFMVLAALAAGVGMASGERFGWGQQFTIPAFKISMTALVFVMALSFLGLWEIPIPGFVGTGTAGKLQTKEGPGGAFFKGVFTTILATPCSGPFLGPVFGYLLKQPPYMAYAIFGAVGLGMASPYLAIGAYPALIRFLPKPGAWMDTFKQLMGFLLLATVVYLFNTITALYVVPTLVLLLGLSFACWWIGRTPITEPGRRTVAWIGGTIVAALLGWFAFSVLLEEPKIAWQRFSPAALAEARADGKTVMVDFTANWCPNCKTNSKVAIETDAVLKAVLDNGVVPMLADWTDKSPVIKKTLNDLGCNSIPVLAIWPAEPAGAKPIILSDLLTQGAVLEALEQAGPSKKP